MTSGAGVRSTRWIAVSSRSAVSISAIPATDFSVIDRASQNKGWSSTIRAEAKGLSVSGWEAIVILRLRDRVWDKSSPARFRLKLAKSPMVRASGKVNQSSPLE